MCKSHHLVVLSRVQDSWRRSQQFENNPGKVSKPNGYKLAIWNLKVLESLQNKKKTTPTIVVHRLSRFACPSAMNDARCWGWCITDPCEWYQAAGLCERLSRRWAVIFLELVWFEPKKQWTIFSWQKSSKVYVTNFKKYQVTSSDIKWPKFQLLKRCFLTGHWSGGPMLASPSLSRMEMDLAAHGYAVVDGVSLNKSWGYFIEVWSSKCLFIWFYLLICWSLFICWRPKSLTWSLSVLLKMPMMFKGCCTW